MKQETKDLIDIFRIVLGVLWCIFALIVLYCVPVEVCWREPALLIGNIVVTLFCSIPLFLSFRE